MSVDANRDADEVLKEDEKKKLQRANLQKYFFTLATKAKNALGLRHPAYYADTQSMFLHVIKAGISVDDWPKFVMEEMSQRPDKWRDEKKIKKLHEM